MDGVEVKGVFNANAFFQTLAAILSRKYGKEITVTVTPPAQDERAARPARGRGKSDQRVGKVRSAGGRMSGGPEPCHKAIDDFWNGGRD